MRNEKMLPFMQIIQINNSGKLGLPSPLSVTRSSGTRPTLSAIWVSLSATLPRSSPEKSKGYSDNVVSFLMACFPLSYQVPLCKATKQTYITHNLQSTFYKVKHHDESNSCKTDLIFNNI